MKSVIKALALVPVLLALAGVALAQQAVVTIPAGATTAGANASSTIAVTNTFQQVFAAAQGVAGVAAARKGCTIVNYGSNTMWVTEGYAVASALKANAIQLAVGQAYYCDVGTTVLQGLVSITGTAAEAFYAAQW
jgi:hypothetical protein